jgi:hypothetical protein
LAVFNVTFRAPRTPGSYYVIYTLRQRNVSDFGAQAVKLVVVT